MKKGNMARIYISSTFRDLEGHREQVYRALRQLGHNVIAMEDYVATDQRPLARCLEDVSACDLYVGIFAHRYGYIPDQDNPDQQSITELEYRHAQALGKPCLIFLLDEAAPWLPNWMDTYTGEGDHGARIRALHEELGRDRLASFFTSSDELARLVSVAVTRQLERDAASQHNHQRAPTASGPAQLPGDVEDFTGRQAELEALISHLKGNGPGPAKVSIDGGPGVGKTALALRLAHAVLSRFPDVQLYENLHGFSEQEPMAVESVLSFFLGTLGVKSEDIPRDPEKAAALYRSRLAQQRVLVVLDNARDEEQVKLLLPGSGPCAVVVTSRYKLVLQGAKRCQLKPFDEHSGDGVDLLARLTDSALRTSDPDAARAVVELCGHLPLAISMAAAAMVRADEDLEGLRARLEASPLEGLRTRPEAFPQEGVEAAFGVSYDLLRADERRLFRILGTPGPRDVTPWAAAALLGRPQAETERLLDGLVAMNLLEVTGRDECRVRRYQMHDLLRQYARILLDTEDSDADGGHALDRLARAYYGCVTYAFDKQNQGNPMVDAEYLAGWQQVKDPLGKAAVDCAGESPAQWFATERENLVALIEQLDKQKPTPAITPRLASSLFYFLEMGGYWKDWQTVDEIGDKVALRLGDNHARARSLRNLGRRDLVLVLEEQDRLQDDTEHGSGALRVPAVGNCAAAIDRLKQSRVLYQESGDLRGEATTVRELADAYRLEGRLSEAVETYAEAAALYRQLPEATRDNATASLRLALGMTYMLQGHYDDAETCIRESLDYASQVSMGGQGTRG
jgi:tetratricopeptide (TPR) repeat protein